MTETIETQAALQQFRRARRLQGVIVLVWAALAIVVILSIVLWMGVRPTDDTANPLPGVVVLPAVVVALLGLWWYRTLGVSKIEALRQAGPAGEGERPEPLGLSPNWEATAALLAGIVVLIVALSLFNMDSAARFIPIGVLVIAGAAVYWRMTFVSRVQRRAYMALESGDVDLAVAQTTATAPFGGAYGRRALLELRQLIFLSVGRYAEAVDVQADIEATATATNPARPGTAYAYALAGAGRATEAMDVLRTLAQHEPDNPQVIISRADILLEHAPAIHAAEAEAILADFDALHGQTFRDFVPAESVDYLARRVWMLAHTGRSDDARALMADIEAKMDSFGALHQAAILYWLGRAAAALGDADAAQRHFGKVVELDPTGAWGMRARRVTG